MRIRLTIRLAPPNVSGTQATEESERRAQAMNSALLHLPPLPSPDHAATTSRFKEVVCISLDPSPHVSANPLFPSRPRHALQQYRPNRRDTPTGTALRAANKSAPGATPVLHGVPRPTIAVEVAAEQRRRDESELATHETGLCLVT